VAGNCLQTLKGRAMADPILIAIDKHRRARRLHVADLVDGDDAAACEAEISAWDKLLATAPTTLAGLSAMLGYVSEWQAGDDGIYADAGDLLAAVRMAAESARMLASQ